MDLSTPAQVASDRCPPARGQALRVGAVAYLNMQPVVYGLTEAWGGAGFDLSLAPPSQLARQLAAGEIDMGMVPVASIFAHPEWRVASQTMIGSRGAVQSVLIMGGAPVGAWRTLRPDSHSMTSNAQARVILKNCYGLEPAAGEPVPLDGWAPPARPTPGEGLVAIGSRALAWRERWRQPDGFTLDLGAAWGAWTGLPFVHALWAVRPGVELGEWPARLDAHKLANRARLEMIANAWPTLAEENLTLAQALHYLTVSIQYDFDDASRAGLERFYAEGRALGLFPPGWRWNPY
jgi:chorismate dehydratase